MRIATLAVCALPVVLAACASTRPPTAAQVQRYDSATQARVRFFGANGIRLGYYANAACVPDRGRVTISGTLAQAFGSMMGARDNRSLGMPMTEYSVAPRSGMLARGYFTEQTVDAGQPLVIQSSFVAAPAARSEVDGQIVSVTGLQCRQSSALFTPEAGQDYEVELVPGPGRCTLHVTRLLPASEGALASTVPVQVAAAVACPRAPVRVTGDQH
jgi:hypothetical protein